MLPGRSSPIDQDSSSSSSCGEVPPSPGTQHKPIKLEGGDVFLGSVSTGAALSVTSVRPSVVLGGGGGGAPTATGVSVASSEASTPAPSGLQDHLAICPDSGGGGEKLKLTTKISMKIFQVTSSDCPTVTVSWVKGWRGWER